MRVTVSHNHGLDATVKGVDEAFARLDALGYGITNVERSWSGSTANFSLCVAVGPFRSPVRGTIAVTEDELTIDADLPRLLTSIVPEARIEGAVRSRVRGLLE